MIRLWRFSSLQHLCSLPFPRSPTVLVPFLKTANVHGGADLCLLALNGAHLQPPRHIWISHFLPPPRRKSDGEKRKCLLNRDISHSCEDTFANIKVKFGLSLLMHLLLIPVPSFRASCRHVLRTDRWLSNPTQIFIWIKQYPKSHHQTGKLETTADLRTSHSLLADVGLALRHITRWVQASFKFRIHSLL